VLHRERNGGAGDADEREVNRSALSNGAFAAGVKGKIGSAFRVFLKLEGVEFFELRRAVSPLYLSLKHE
jgi:hypothetical protein